MTALKRKKISEFKLSVHGVKFFFKQDISLKDFWVEVLCSSSCLSMVQGKSNETF